MFFSNRLAIYSALGIITSTAGVTQLILNAQVPYDIIVSNEMRYGQETNIKLKEGSKIVTNDERVEYLISNNIDNIARHVYYDPINYSLRYQSVLKNDVDIIITAKLDGAVKAEEKITFKGYERSDSKYDYHNFIPTELLEITDFNELVGIKENAYINEYDSLLVSNFVTEISDNSFLNLPNNIKYLVCEENSILTKIGIDAFYNTGLGEIYLDSKNPIAFYDTAFSGLSKLTKFVTAANLQLGASE
jgi:hypothetical protein